MAAQARAQQLLMLQSQARRQQHQPFRHWSKWKAAEHSRWLALTPPDREVFSNME